MTQKYACSMRVDTNIVTKKHFSCGAKNPHAGLTERKSNDTQHQGELRRPRDTFEGCRGTLYPRIHTEEPLDD